MNVRAVCYVLKSFPEPSETFIAEEIFSVMDRGVKVLILSMYDGTTSVIHPVAQRVLDGAVLARIGAANRSEVMKAFGQLLLRSPIRSLKTFFKALRHPQRWMYFQALPAALRCVEEGSEFIHSHYADVNFLYAEKISEWLGVPFGVTTHRYDILDDPIELNSAKNALKAAGLVVTISEYNRQHMSRKYEMPASDVQIVHCGIDLGRFAYGSKKAREPGQPLRLVNVGRLVHIKAQDVLLQALAVVRGRGRSVVLDVVGGGELHAELLALAATLGVADIATFHGAQPEQVVKQMLSEADLFVLSSRSEGLPVACIEALATGTPVLATRIFGIPELIEHQVSGLLVPVEDPAALADAILWAADHPQELAQMRVTGRKVVEAGFERKTCTTELLAHWGEAVKASA